MNRANYDIAVLDEIKDEPANAHFRELNDLQLALVGGGSADPLFQ